MRFIYIYFSFFIINFTFSQKSIFDVARFGTVEELELLVKDNPNCINDVDKNGYTPLILATYRENSEVVKKLLYLGVEVDYLSNSGTALMASVFKGNLEILKLLLENNANINLQDSNGKTALVLAVNTQNMEVIKIILKYNPNLEINDNYSKKALDYALQTNNKEIIDLFTN